MKYKEWMEEWLKQYVKPTVKHKTYERYGEAISGHISVGLGDYEMDELTPLVLQRFIVEQLHGGNLKTGCGLSSSTVNGIITVIQSSLRVAHGIGLVREYTADKIKRPKTAEKQVICFSLAEQVEIERAAFACREMQLRGIVLCMYTGLRIGELLALEWNDVDFSREQLTITKTCHYGKNHDGKFARITNAPKTSASVRTIPVPKQIIELLGDMKNQSESRYVISHNGKPIDIRAYQRSFETMLKRLKIPHKGFHALRHTFATRALECGMDVKTLSEILGHKNPMITLNRYVHSLSAHKREMMNRIGNLCTSSCGNIAVDLRSTFVYAPCP